MNPSSRTSPALQVALVGCGHIARKHIAAITSLSDRIQAVGVVDPDLEARSRAGSALGSPAFETLEELLETTNVDLVALATPTGLHPRQAIASAEAGAHILTEKPLGTCLDSARSMVKRVADLKRRLFIVKQLRYHPLFNAVRHAVEQGRFGQLHTIGLQIFWSRPQSYYDAAGWRGTRALDGGALMNQASHYVDLLDWLFGPVEEVHAVGGALGRSIEMEDTAVVTLKWEQGFIGSLHVTMLAYPKNLATSLTVIGDRGTVRLGGPLCDQIEAWDFADPVPEDDHVATLARSVPQSLRCGHEKVYQNVLAHLDGVESVTVDGQEGLRSLAIIDAAYQALESGVGVVVSPQETESLLRRKLA